MSSSLLLFPQRFGRYVLRPSSGVCRTREPSRNFELRPLFDKHLKKAGGHIGRNVVEITKMKTIVRKPLRINLAHEVIITQRDVYLKVGKTWPWRKPCPLCEYRCNYKTQVNWSRVYHDWLIWKVCDVVECRLYILWLWVRSPMGEIPVYTRLMRLDKVSSAVSSVPLCRTECLPDFLVIEIQFMNRLK